MIYPTEKTKDLLILYIRRHDGMAWIEKRKWKFSFYSMMASKHWEKMFKDKGYQTKVIRIDNVKSPTDT
jgi:hypothetical protein